MKVALDELANFRRAGTPRGLSSVCSAHPVVLRAALRYGRESGTTVLIEATCNQVNHLGGYTGMNPADFAALVATIANEETCPAEQIVLGGDHLGPNPWRSLAAEQAMDQAEAMVSAYVTAGFRKIHLDASMGCAGEPEALDNQTTAHRAARLAAVAEKAAQQAGGQKPLYIIGTEVPPPGGADHVLDTITPTSAEAAKCTLSVHEKVFTEAGLVDAFERAIGIVVQPGVEFGNSNVIQYQRDKATDLIQVLESEPKRVFEAHSTDYQNQQMLSKLVQDGFAILKVGPELTFVLREALYALDLIATDLLPESEYGNRQLFNTMELIMTSNPEHWDSHYHGSDAEKALLRHYSLSDRIRYYWATPEAQAAVDKLLSALSGQSVPFALLSQHFTGAEHFADQPLVPEDLLIHRVTQSLAKYQAACQVGSTSQQ